MTTGRPSSSAAATERTAPPWPVNGLADRGAGGQVPDPHRLVAAGDDDRAAVQVRRRDRVATPSWPVSGSPTGVPVARSQTRTVRSSLPEMTTGRPSSSAAATAHHPSSWPVSGSPTGVPVARSQTRTMPSQPPLTMREPSGVIATDQTGCE